MEWDHVEQPGPEKVDAPANLEERPPNVKAKSDRNVRLFDWVCSTDVRGTGLKELAGLQKLETLRLFGFGVADAVCRESWQS
jgi:hypothetical protein